MLADHDRIEPGPFGLNCECDQVGLPWLNVDCLSGCRNLVGRLSKLERVIVAQTRLVKTLDPESLEFRTEKADLDLLMATRDRVMQQQRYDAEAKCYNDL